MLISDKEKKTVSVLGHFFAAIQSKDQLKDNCQTPDLPRSPSLSNDFFFNEERDYIGSSLLFGLAGLTLKFLEIFNKILHMGDIESLDRCG